jgi:hypothetical protein
MKLVKIEGCIWELTTLGDGAYAKPEDVNDGDSVEDANMRAIHGFGWNRGLAVPLAKHQVKSTAKAVLEIIVSGLPRQQVYDIYHGPKGYFCKVQGQRVFLHDLVDRDEVLYGS